MPDRESQAAVLFDSSYGNTKKLLNPEIEELFGDPYGNRIVIFMSIYMCFIHTIVKLTI